jgi:hypothetical protein
MVLFSNDQQVFLEDLEASVGFFFGLVAFVVLMHEFFE